MKSLYYKRQLSAALALSTLMMTMLSSSTTASFAADSSAVNASNSGKAARTKLIVYSDYQCPGCARLAPRMKDLQRKLGSSLILEHRHYPLARHKNSFIAACAAESAARQGKFSQMQDLLYGGQREWAYTGSPLTVFTGYAQRIGLNVAKFNADITSASVKSKISQDMKAGTIAGLRETPTVFVNGQALSGKNLNKLENTVYESIKRLHS